MKEDICDQEAVNQMFGEKLPDFVVKFAAESHVDRSFEYTSIFLQANIMGTAAFTDFCIKRYHQVPTDEGLNVSEWLYIEDHCKAIDLIIHNGKVGEVYNVGVHNEKLNIEIVKIICKKPGRPGSYF